MLQSTQNEIQHGSEWFVITSQGNYVYSDPELSGDGSLKLVKMTYVQWLMERDGYEYVEFGSI